MIKRLAVLACAFVLGWLLVGTATAQTSGPAPFQGVSAYSNADGSTQFMMLRIVDGDFALTGQTLVLNDGIGGWHSYTFTREVPDRRPGKFVLIGTQGFADLNLVRPDFVVPNAFLFAGSNRIRIGSTGWSGVDGILCAFEEPAGSGCAGTYGAINNAGQTAFWVTPVSPSYGGLWWNAPAGSEPGWAIAVEHQGTVVVAAWVTYDADGAPVWFVMPRGEIAFSSYGYLSPYEFTGAIYRMRGPPTGSTSFDASKVGMVEVGTGGLRLAATMDDWGWEGMPVDLGGTFWYAFQNSPTVAKYITRQRFAPTSPVCTLGGAPGAIPNYQGLWWNAAEPGWGLYVAHEGDVVFAVWLTYDATGGATWLTFTANRSGPDSYAGEIYRTTGPPFNAATFDSSAIRAAAVGKGSLTFSGRDNGAFSYVANGVSHTTAIARQVFALPASVCN